jgi:hypothetical protein
MLHRAEGHCVCYLSILLESAFRCWHLKSVSVHTQSLSLWNKGVGLDESQFTSHPQSVNSPQQTDCEQAKDHVRDKKVLVPRLEGTSSFFSKFSHSCLAR